MIARLFFLLVPAAESGELRAEAQDVRYSGSGELALGSLRLRLEGQQLLRPDGSVLTDSLYGPPVSSGTWVCAADEDVGGLGRLRCWDVQLQPVLLATGGRPGRLAIQGGMLAWVASPAGLPQVFVAPADGSAAPRALTNEGLHREVGRAPDGFVPPPLRQTLVFEGDWLRWESAEGAQAVQWR